MSIEKKGLLRWVAGAAVGLLPVTSCAPPTSQELPQPREIVVVVTATPTEIPTPLPATSTTEPVTATPEPPTATPAPARREQPPAPALEVLFQTPAWRVHKGSLTEMAARPPVGQAVIVPLPNREIFAFAHGRRVCEGVEKFFYVSMLVDPSSIAGRGFSQTDRFANVVTAGVIRSGLLGGNIILQAGPPVAGEPNCKREQFSFQLEDEGSGRQVLGVALADTKRSVSGGDNSPEEMIALAEKLGNFKLPVDVK